MTSHALRYRNARQVRHTDLRKDISPTDRGILETILSMAQLERDTWGVLEAAHVPIRAIAKMSKRGERTVKRAIKRLKAANAIQVHRGTFNRRAKLRSASSYYMTFDSVCADKLPRWLEGKNWRNQILQARNERQKLNADSYLRAKMAPMKSENITGVKMAPMKPHHGGHHGPNSYSYSPTESVPWPTTEPSKERH